MKIKSFRWRLWLARCVIAGIAFPIGWVVLYALWTPPITHLMVSRAWDRWQEDAPWLLKHSTVSLDSISPSLPLAVIAGEDQLFLQHDGFDVKAIEKALQHNRSHKRKRGASTISQQTAKNAFLWEGRSWIRKGLEVPFTLAMETLWSKRRILEVYLNIAEFGPGIFGAEAASQHWFHKPATKLSREESARLAAMLPSPRKCNPKAPAGKYAARVSWVLGQMNWQDQKEILATLDLRLGKSKPKKTQSQPFPTSQPPPQKLEADSAQKPASEIDTSEEPVLEP